MATAQPTSLFNEVFGCKVGESYGSFVLGWFAVPFLIAMVIGLLIEYWLSPSKCVNGSAFQTVTLASLGVGVFTGILAFVVHKFACKTRQ